MSISITIHTVRTVGFPAWMQIQCTILHVTRDNIRDPQKTRLICTEHFICQWFSPLSTKTNVPKMYRPIPYHQQMADKRKRKAKVHTRTGHEDPGGSRSILYSFFTLTLDRVGGQRHAQPLYPRGKDPVPIVYEVGWTPGLVWTDAENLAPIAIRSPDRPARSQSL
jgi:hypothetical protein